MSTPAPVPPGQAPLGTPITLSRISAQSFELTIGEARLAQSP
jgi:hypothetical protein